jgi:hypothetical protein
MVVVNARLTLVAPQFENALQELEVKISDMSQCESNWLMMTMPTSGEVTTQMQAELGTKQDTYVTCRQLAVWRNAGTIPSLPAKRDQIQMVRMYMALKTIMTGKGIYGITADQFSGYIRTIIMVPWYRYNGRLSRNGHPGPMCSAEGWKVRYRGEPPLGNSLLCMVLASVPECPTLVALSLGVGTAGLAGLRQSSRSVYMVLYHDRVWWMSWTWKCSCLECKISWIVAGWMCPLTMREVFEDGPRS